MSEKVVKSYIKVSLDFPTNKRKHIITDDGVLRSNISDAIAQLIEDYYEKRIIGLPAIHVPHVPLILSICQHIQCEEPNDEQS